MAKKDKKSVSKAIKSEYATRELTFRVGLKVKGTTFKKRGPKALKQVRKFAREEMRTRDVRIDTKLNAFLFSKGIRNVPKRVRVRLSRKRNEDEDAEEKAYTLVEYVPCVDFKGLRTENIISI
eukprot:CAMPEP_0171459448 /NCGR_PEP_ID=MMETSP0945-20130129/4728_1 /TAXON_ID=109269 /ORGANISM="Vaucheria litorea, Strain CCMP2940" /LENGTH=122 /DNA_ID=CAMNT_0011985469 /DNA_START=16 /DNA_END=384 /DNA_ORIENTATION=-